MMVILRLSKSSLMGSFSVLVEKMWISLWKTPTLSMAFRIYLTLDMAKTAKTIKKLGKRQTAKVPVPASHEDGKIVHIQPKIGEGIYLVKDVAKILRLDYEKTYRWIVGYWGIGGLEEGTRYTFGEVGNRAINFYSLIEFYTFFKLREKGASSTQIKNLHHELSKIHNTEYPFAKANDFFIDGRHKRKFIYYEYVDSLIKLDQKHQFLFKFIESFLEKIEFDDNNLATRFFPLHNSKNVVVDPKHQFGQPTITGTNIKTQTLYSLYRGGESLENISILYNISIDKVTDAIGFQKAA